MRESLGTWGERLAAARAGLEAKEVEEAAVKLRWLAAHLLGCGLLGVERRHPDEPSAAVASAFDSGVARLASGEPVQYVIGETDFMGLRIRCDRRALIPRPETELLVECAEDYLRGLPGAPRVVDACTGTGCIACALALRVPGARVVATDISADALALARENARELGAVVEFVHTDLLAELPDACADLVVSNPPYVAAGECERLSPTVRDFEPRLALDGGADGLRAISRLVREAPRVIVGGGRLMMEIGDDQADAVQELLCQTPHLHPIGLRADYAGRARLVLARREPW
jgi:release factor glutamine methyltransferase